MLIVIGVVVGRYRGVEPRSNVSMIIMLHHARQSRLLDFAKSSKSPHSAKHMLQWPGRSPDGLQWSAWTQALERRAYDRLAQPLPPSRQGLGKSQLQRSCLLETRLHCISPARIRLAGLRKPLLTIIPTPKARRKIQCASWQLEQFFCLRR